MKNTGWCDVGAVRTVTGVGRCGRLAIIWIIATCSSGDDHCVRRNVVGDGRNSRQRLRWSVCDDIRLAVGASSGVTGGSILRRSGWIRFWTGLSGLASNGSPTAFSDKVPYGLEFGYNTTFLVGLGSLRRDTDTVSVSGSR